MKYYMGVDLGLAGCISIIDNNGKIIICEPIPTISVMVNKKIRRQYDIVAINELFKSWTLDFKDFNIVKAMIERMRPIPMQSAQTGFSLGGSMMLFKTLFTIYGIAYVEAEPVLWQREIFGSQGIQYDKNTTKEASILAAKQLFPGFCFRKTEKCRVDSSDMTDSVLIAEFLRRTTK